MVKKGIEKKESESMEGKAEKLECKSKKTTAKSKDIFSKRKCFIQFWGREVEEEALIEQFKTQWKKEHTLSEIKDLKMYFKVDEEIAYFVVNEKETIAINFI